MSIFDEMDLVVNDFWEAMPRKEEFVAEEDLDMEWEQFHSKYPKIEKHEYELMVKQTQEM